MSFETETILSQISYNTFSKNKKSLSLYDAQKVQGK